MSAPLVVVIGSTGAQGGSVVKYLLESDKKYKIRGLTRDTSKPAATALKDKGVEVVSADVSKPEDAKRAFEGADIVFAVTSFWEHQDAQRELRDGKTLVDAAKAANVKRFIWSGLHPVKKISGGKLTHVGHFDSKAEIAEYAKSIGIPIVDVQAGQYAQNFLTMTAPRKQEDGSFLFVGPQTPQTLTSLLDIAEYGKWVVAAIESPEVTTGTEVLAAAEYISYEDIAKQWSEGTGKKATYVQIPKDQFQKAAGEEFTEMLLWFQDYGYYAGKDLAPSLKLVKGPITKWAEFVKKQDWSKITG